ncbi:hypothetical protein C5754_12505 [Listeria monocytogenes]|nr:hypothetical protein [Listeria monocytogenes]EAC8000761.1 hypothetical protein [Listeria monocytogenes]EAD9140532.1 hypothetical protein [Listeria monocytogenes]EAE0903766.1 hypothetical protein [Listeria monocytogenes]EAF5120083.1 hypothetical protein [Listeria monocytogenes]
MRSLLTEKLYELGFLCGIELEIYIQDTGKYTSLIIEGDQKGGGATYHYDFYKQTFYPHSLNKITVYGENMTAVQLLERVESYLCHRQQYLAELSNKTKT